MSVACMVVTFQEQDSTLPAGQPWTGHVEIQQQADRIAIALDSDLDQQGLDGKADAVFLAFLSEERPYSLPPSLGSSVVLLDKPGLAVEVDQRDSSGKQSALARFILDGSAPSSRRNDEGHPSRDESGTAIPVRAIVFRLGDTGADLRETSEAMFEKADAEEVFSSTSSHPCTAGGPGAVAASTKAHESSTYGVLCPHGYFACCPGKAEQLCECVPMRQKTN